MTYPVELAAGRSSTRRSHDVRTGTDAVFRTRRRGPTAARAARPLQRHVCDGSEERIGDDVRLGRQRVDVERRLRRRLGLRRLDATAVVLVVFFALLITALVLAVRYLGGGGGHRGSGQARAAEDVLAERFARGEIDDEEFRKRVTLLREHR